MKLFILLALLALASCGSQKVDTAASTATESNAKPVSPYTVKPCLCMKIFKPVCADGRNFGNSCEAECNGHKKWTDGSCKSAPKK